MPTHYLIRRVNDERFFVGPLLKDWSKAKRDAFVFKNEQHARKTKAQLEKHKQIVRLVEKQIPNPPKAIRTPKQAAARIVQKLKAKGFIIQQYEATSSKSIYIKLNYGLSKTIRISDHESKKEYLHYRYNLIVGGDPHKTSQQNDGKLRLFYTEKTIQDLIQTIIHIYEEQVTMHGKENMAQYIQNQKKIEAENPSRFWKNAIKL